MTFRLFGGAWPKRLLTALCKVRVSRRGACGKIAKLAAKPHDARRRDFGRQAFRF